MESPIELSRNNLYLEKQKIIGQNKRKYEGFFYLGLVLLVIAVYGFAPSFYQGLLIEMMIFAVLAMSLDLLVGYTGLISFGHAAFFGLSAYVTAIMMSKFEISFFVSVIMAILITVLVAFLIGLLCAKLSGIQFAMLTLAFGQLIWTVVTKWRSLTNGMDGFSLTKGNLISFGGMKIVLSDPRFLLFFMVIVLIFCHWSIKRIVQSPFGQALLAIKENEERTKFLGFNHYRVKVQVFVISAFYASIAGSCYVLLKMFVAPEYLHFSFSGNILMMTLLGGIGTLTGPLLGAATFVWLQDWLSSLTENWMAYVGIIFILVVLYLPKGVFGWLFKR